MPEINISGSTNAAGQPSAVNPGQFYTPFGAQPWLNSAAMMPGAGPGAGAVPPQNVQRILEDIRTATQSSARYENEMRQMQQMAASRAHPAFVRPQGVFDTAPSSRPPPPFVRPQASFEEPPSARPPPPFVRPQASFEEPPAGRPPPPFVRPTIPSEDGRPVPGFIRPGAPERRAVPGFIRPGAPERRPVPGFVRPQRVFDEAEEEGPGFSFGGGFAVGRGIRHAMGHSGMGAAGGLIGMGLSGPGGLIMAGAAGLLAPRQIGAAISDELLTYTEGYRSFYKQTQAFGRAGGFGGENLEAMLYSGDPRIVPELMARYGLSPEEATGILSEYGIAPRSAGEASQTISTLAATGLRTRQGFAGMPRSFSIGMARQAAAMGLSGPSGEGRMWRSGETTIMPDGAVRLPEMNTTGGPTPLQSFLNKMDEIMTAAVAAGLDRSQVGSSMMTAFSYLAGRGVPQIGVGGVAAVMQQSFMSNLPGGRTGQLGLSTIEGIGQSMEGAFTTPLGSVVAMNMVRSASTREGLAAALGASQAGGDRKKAVEIGMQYIEQMEKAGQGDVLANYFKMAQQGNPAAFESLRSIIEGANPYAWPAFAQQQIAGMPLPPGMGPTLLRRFGFPSVPAATEFGRNLSYGGVPAMPGSPGADMTLPRGLRDRNPLNLGFVPGQPGVIGHEGGGPGDVRGVPKRGFGIYPTMGAGINAALQQLFMYQARGLTTIRQITKEWGTGHAEEIAKAMGVSPDVPIDMHDPKIAGAYIREAAKHESGAVSEEDINAGLNIAFGRAAPDMGGGTATMPSKLQEMLRTEAGVGQQRTGAQEEVWSGFGGFIGRLPEATEQLVQFRNALIGATAAIRKREPKTEPDPRMEPRGPYYGGPT